MLTIDADLATLERDPYPVFERIRSVGPIAWMDALGLYYVVGYTEVRQILLDDVHFSTGTDHSLLFDTFGAHMLTLNGAEQQRQRGPFRGAFAPTAIKARMTDSVKAIANNLIDGFALTKTIDVRSAFAARLPVLAILNLFGMAPAQEPLLRRCYDVFERALSNFDWNEMVRADAKGAAAEFHALLRQQIALVRQRPGEDLLSAVVHDRGAASLSDEEIIRNASIIFFGGISTVEALLLNTLYACARHKVDLKDIDERRLATIVDEVMRWQSPVQSATRHVTKAIEIAGVAFKPGDTVNCMLGAANRDPNVFSDAEVFAPDRGDASRHLGFATGAHFCLGSHLARLEVSIAIGALFERLPGFAVHDVEHVHLHGCEFRQPRTMTARWLSKSSQTEIGEEAP
jgi:cytochrome P450